MNSPESAVPPPGRHGDDGPAVARALGLGPASLLDLSQNLNPFAPDVAGLAARHLGELRRYPDPAAATRLLAEAMGADADRLVLTNGAAEAISLVTAEIGGQVWSEPEFGLHPRGDSGPVWRSDPHNPSGRLVGPHEAPDLWDEAFHPLATDRWTAGRSGISVRSLTKTSACPGSAPMTRRRPARRARRFVRFRSVPRSRTCADCGRATGWQHSPTPRS